MVAEVAEFFDAFDSFYMIARDMEKTINCSIPVYIYTDSKQLFYAMKKGRRTTERILVVDIAPA